MGSTPVTVPDSVSVLSLVRPPLVMLVVKPVSVKIVLPSDSDKSLLVLVVVEPVSVPPIFGYLVGAGDGDCSRRRRGLLDRAV